MDRITALLDGPRARGAFLLRSLLVPPWSMRICDEAPLTIVAVTRGEAWIIDDESATHLVAGSVGIIRGPGHYTVADTPTTPPDIIIHPGQRCESVGGASLAMSMRLGVRTWGHAVDAPTAMLTGTYENHTALGERSARHAPQGRWWFTTTRATRSQRSLPRRPRATRQVNRRCSTGCSMSSSSTPCERGISSKARRRRGGKRIKTHWSARRSSLMHDAPERAWTIATLARSVGTSRAHLARRFNDLVGEPPITYLTKWRLSLGADLLCQPSSSVTSTARAVGYGSPFAFSTAFKRRYGISPHQHRVQAIDDQSPL